MCDCAHRVHPGIKCGESGCTCHKDSPTVWVMWSSGSVFSVTSEDTAVRFAEMYEDVGIYFFASLIA